MTNIPFSNLQVLNGGDSMRISIVNGKVMIGSNNLIISSYLYHPSLRMLGKSVTTGITVRIRVTRLDIVSSNNTFLVFTNTFFRSDSDSAVKGTTMSICATALV